MRVITNPETGRMETVAGSDNDALIRAEIAKTRRELRAMLYGGTHAQESNVDTLKTWAVLVNTKTGAFAVTPVGAVTHETNAVTGQLLFKNVSGDVVGSVDDWVPRTATK